MTHEEPCIDSLIHSCRPTPQHERLNVLCYRAPILSPLISKYRHGHQMFFFRLSPGILGVWKLSWVQPCRETSWVGFINCPVNTYISLSSVFFFATKLSLRAYCKTAVHARARKRVSGESKQRARVCVPKQRRLAILSSRHLATNEWKAFTGKELPHIFTFCCPKGALGWGLPPFFSPCPNLTSVIALFDHVCNYGESKLIPLPRVTSFQFVHGWWTCN